MLLTLPAAVLLSALLAQQPLRVVGEFSNMRYSAEHEYGYSVQLWARGDELFGLFEAASGLQGDTPVGVLEQVHFEPASGKLVFRSKLTTGVQHTSAGDTPARDLFEFQGALRRGVLSGVIKHTVSGVPGDSNPVKLRRISKPSLPAFEDLPAWQKYADDLLRRRGPKW